MTLTHRVPGCHPSAPLGLYRSGTVRGSIGGSCCRRGSRTWPVSWSCWRSQITKRGRMSQTHGLTHVHSGHWLTESPATATATGCRAEPSVPTKAWVGSESTQVSDSRCDSRLFKDQSIQQLLSIKNQLIDRLLFFQLTLPIYDHKDKIIIYTLLS